LGRRLVGAERRLRRFLSPFQPLRFLRQKPLRPQATPEAFQTVAGVAKRTPGFRRVFRIQPWKGCRRRRPSNEDLCNPSKVDLRFRRRFPGACSARPGAIVSHPSGMTPDRRIRQTMPSRDLTYASVRSAQSVVPAPFSNFSPQVPASAVQVRLRGGAD
jgi:hypothetical protein